MTNHDMPIYAAPCKDDSLFPKMMDNQYPKLYLKFHAGRGNYWPVTIIGEHVSLPIFEQYVDWVMTQFAGVQTFDVKKINTGHENNDKMQMIKFSHFFDIPSDKSLFEMSDMTPDNWGEIQNSRIDTLISKTRNESSKDSDFLKTIEKMLGHRHPRVIQEKDRLLESLLE